MTNDISEALTNIISKNENDDYVCKELKVTIPAHKKKIFPTDKKGNKILDSNTKIKEKLVHEKSYYYIVIMKREAYKKLLKLNFKNSYEIEMALEYLTKFYVRYNGILYANVLYDKFPYLKDFFTALDNWREITGMVIVDEVAISEGYSRVFRKHK